MIIRPITYDLHRPITRGITEPVVGAFSPNSAFFAGAQGFSYDLSDASKLYIDSGRTILVTTPGDLIGSITDLSGNGNHASQTTTASKPSWQTTYAQVDGADDFWTTSSVDFTATDEVTVVVGLRKLSDVLAGVVCELGPSAAGNGSFTLSAPLTAVTGNYGFRSRGTSSATANAATFAAPDTAVISGRAEISANSVTIRRNTVAGTASGAVQGTGNYGNLQIYIGRRAGTSTPYNGRIYRMIVIGRMLNDMELAQAERWCNATTGAF